MKDVTAYTESADYPQQFFCGGGGAHAGALEVLHTRFLLLRRSCLAFRRPYMAIRDASFRPFFRMQCALPSHGGAPMVITGTLLSHLGASYVLLRRLSRMEAPLFWIRTPIGLTGAPLSHVGALWPQRFLRIQAPFFCMEAGALLGGKHGAPASMTLAPSWRNSCTRFWFGQLFTQFGQLPSEQNSFVSSS